MKKIIESVKGYISFIWNWVTDSEPMESEPMELQELSIAVTDRLVTIKTPFPNQSAMYWLEETGIKIMLTHNSKLMTHTTTKCGRLFINKQEDVQQLLRNLYPTTKGKPRKTHEFTIFEGVDFTVIEVSYNALSGL